MARLKFGYNTNGFAHHALEDALRIISDLGYDGVALTLDVHHLNPFKTTQSDLRALKRLLKRLRLDVVIETGARYLLDPVHKHEPCFISAKGAVRRIAFTKKAVDIAAVLEAPVVTVYSGALHPRMRAEEARMRLAAGLRSVCKYAASCGVIIGLEPEPGMFIDTIEGYAGTKRDVDHPALKLTVDVGHLVCCEQDAPGYIITRLADEIVNAHIEDIKGASHNHLPPGEGEINFRPILEAFRTINFSGLIGVELSRNSHNAPEAARNAIKFFNKIRQV
jgi:sugar phosphate isomerase/epimerase